MHLARTRKDKPAIGQVYRRPKGRAGTHGVPLMAECAEQVQSADKALLATVNLLATAQRTSAGSVKRNGYAKSGALILLKAYQVTHLVRQPACRFYPSCSKYAFAAINKHGLLRGLLLTLVRLSKCHPFHAGGVDEVPEELFAGWHAIESSSMIWQLLTRRIVGARSMVMRLRTRRIVGAHCMRPRIHAVRSSNMGAII